MYKQIKPRRTSLTVNTSYEGETIEAKIRRIVNNKEPISDGAPLIYTNRKDGVLPEYDIKTDRFEIAVDAMDKVTKTNLAKRAEKNKEPEPSKPKPTEPNTNDGVVPK
jgi:hypothetical protein